MGRDGDHRQIDGTLVMRLAIDVPVPNWLCHWRNIRTAPEQLAMVFGSREMLFPALAQGGGIDDPFPSQLLPVRATPLLMPATGRAARRAWGWRSPSSGGRRARPGGAGRAGGAAGACCPTGLSVFERRLAAEANSTTRWSRNGTRTSRLQAMLARSHLASVPSDQRAEKREIAHAVDGIGDGVAVFR